MAAVGTLSHDVAARTSAARSRRAESPGWATARSSPRARYPLGAEAADHVYSMWNASPPHHAIMFSGTYNYVGRRRRPVRRRHDLGGRDHDRVAATTPLPWPGNRSLTRSGRDVRSSSGPGPIRGSRPTRRDCAPSTCSIAARQRVLAHDSRTTRPVPTRSSLIGLAATGTGSASRRRTGAVTLSPWTSEIRIWVP